MLKHSEENFEKYSTEISVFTIIYLNGDYNVSPY